MEEIKYWFDGFKKFSILEDIESNYNMKAIIGSGSSGIVRIAYKFENNKTFAIKSIPKINYTEKGHSFVCYLNNVGIVN